MIDLNDLNSYKADVDEMYHKIIHLPEQIEKAYFSAVIHKPNNWDELLSEMNSYSPKRIIIVGMGGSAISGDIIQAAFASLIPIEVYKDYGIPLINSDDLLLICSYSGNTEETLSCFKQGEKITKMIGAVTCNGELRERVEGKYLWCELQQGFPPRSAIAALFFSLIKLLENFQLIPSQTDHVKRTVATLMLKAGAIARNVDSSRNIAKQSASIISGKIPLIYSAYPGLGPIAYRWKCQINENAKYPAFHHTFPEMNHNEIEAWECQTMNSSFIPVFLNDFKLDENYSKRTLFLKQKFEELGVEFLDFYSEGESYIERAFSLIYLGDMVSYYLGILQEVDPTKIDFINQLKQQIS